MRKLIALLSVAILAGCGGGGGGGGGGAPSNATLVGRVLDVQTGGALASKPTVQTSAGSILAGADGSFTVPTPNASTSATVDTHGAFGLWNFLFAPANGTVDLGDLYVGPIRVGLIGRVLDATNGLPIQNASVTFAGRHGATGLDGKFSLSEVAYSNTTQAAFWGIVGSATATDYFAQSFTAAPRIAVAGKVDLGDVLLTPSNDPNPPGLPFTVTGKVLPLGTSDGTIVTLKQAGTPVRIFTVGVDGRYSFWILPGAYTVSYQRGALTAAQQSVTVVNQNTMVTVPDATLH